jgi:chromosome segregation ATPase
MIPNLLEATNEYWQQLNELEAAYQRGEVTLAEVDARVKELMAELGRSRRASLSYLWSGLRRLWDEQREAIVGIAGLGVLTYGWLIVH